MWRNATEIEGLELMHGLSPLARLENLCVVSKHYASHRQAGKLVNLPTRKYQFHASRRFGCVCCSCYGYEQLIDRLPLPVHFTFTILKMR
jgi:hypothetical protein